ncbi:Grx4 family monothiol glutaredoxin [Halobacteriovorax sp. XZX-3]|uniref:Grx4 family monothiol glutaredoxin n=1 Tax=unclassified Halobacteriovorax TaxID=2639665 RepID=UPI0037220676
MSDNPFNILGKESTPINQGEAVSGADKSKELNEQIEALIGSAELFLFMKGTPDMPMCGFSANTIAMLNSVGKPYKTFNILEDMDIREGVKVYSNWPTYPQLYFKGELVGGNDIITEMFQSGQLQEVLNS